MNNNSFDAVWEELKQDGAEQKKVMELAEETADIIKKLSDERIRRGLTQQQLAEMCGMKQAAIARLEAAQTMPRLDTVLKVAKALEMRIDVQKIAEIRGSATIDTRQSTSYRTQPYVYRYRSYPGILAPA